MNSVLELLQINVEWCNCLLRTTIVPLDLNRLFPLLPFHEYIAGHQLKSDALLSPKLYPEGKNGAPQRH